MLFFCKAVVSASLILEVGDRLGLACRPTDGVMGIEVAAELRSNREELLDRHVYRPLVLFTCTMHEPPG